MAMVVGVSNERKMCRAKFGALGPSCTPSSHLSVTSTYTHTGRGCGRAACFGSKLLTVHLLIQERKHKHDLISCAKSMGTDEREAKHPNTLTITDIHQYTPCKTASSTGPPLPPTSPLPSASIPSLPWCPPRRPSRTCTWPEFPPPCRSRPGCPQ